MKAVIFGCSGESLTDAEKVFFERADPLGFILFSRNCQNSLQLNKLTDELRATVGRKDVPILIDQEGGRICRLNPEFWRTPPSAMSFGDLYEEYPEEAFRAVYDNSRLIAHDLLAAGINVNCAPVADLPTPDAHSVISDRSFSSYLDINTSLCLASIQGYQDMGITPILKHFPGHGRATVDSHLELPVIHTPLHELYASDFDGFKQILSALNHMLRPTPWGMTAHVILSAIDDTLPVTFSQKVMDSIIRGYMDFQGFLLSDDLCMKALSGSMGERTRAAMLGGCDAVLHCNGDMAEMVDVAASAPELSDESLERIQDSQPQKIEDSFDTLDILSKIKGVFDLRSSPSFSEKRQ